MPSSYEYDSQPIVRSVISVIACVIIGAILLFAGIGKLSELGTIPGQTDFLDKFIPDFIFTPEFARFIGLVFIPWILPISEIIIGAALVIGIWPRIFAILFIPMVFGFMANNSYAISIGLEEFPECECFGIFATLTPIQSMYMDVGMFILAVLIIIIHPGGFFAHQFWINRIFSINKI
ncbi:MAG: DoxX family membrane protein [Dehalococcoidia bacterium]|nr:DoxX family membrane protein [Dehalococcoidia bacterium]